MARELIIAASGRSAAERWATSRASSGEPAADVLTKTEIAGARELAHTLVTGGYERLYVHTASWERQLNPQRYLWWLARAPVGFRAIADNEHGRTTAFGSRELLLRSAIAAAGIPIGMAAAGRELLPLHGAARRGRPPRRERAVLAIWLGGAGEAVGGSVTHISGILSGYRAHGLRVGLVTSSDPPPQLAAAIDELELAAPLAPRQRATAEISTLAMNRALRDAARRLAARLFPCLVHQRHRGFLHAGLDVAQALGLPSVLEWNSPERWTRRHWSSARAGGRLFDRWLPAHERRSVRRAHLIAAVSPLAAEMAIETGADPGRVLVVPNGVDLDAVDAALLAAPAGAAPGGTGRERLIGWVGSFGPWHGAEVLVRALAHLPPEIRLVMIGDGSGRAGCRELARALGVDRRIEWTGMLDHDAALRRLAGCAVLASPQRDTGDRPFFGSPTKLFEYMALGRPIVTTRAGAVSDLIDDGRTGLLVPQEDPRALADGLARVLGDNRLAAALGAAARDEAVARHSWRLRAGAIIERLGPMCAGS